MLQKKNLAQIPRTQPWISRKPTQVHAAAATCIIEAPPAVNTRYYTASHVIFISININIRTVHKLIELRL